MSVRRQTANRLTLFRTCGTCGKQIVTTADTPWVRQAAQPGLFPQLLPVGLLVCPVPCPLLLRVPVPVFQLPALLGLAVKPADVLIAGSKAALGAEVCRGLPLAVPLHLTHPGQAAADSAYARRKRKLIAEEAQANAG